MTQSAGPSVATLVRVFAAIFLLLVVSIVLDRVTGTGLVIALGLSALKAILVTTYFMHVRYSSRLTLAFVASGLLWLGILFGLTLSDVLTRYATHELG